MVLLHFCSACLKHKLTPLSTVFCSTDSSGGQNASRPSSKGKVKRGWQGLIRRLSGSRESNRDRVGLRLLFHFYYICKIPKRKC